MTNYNLQREMARHSCTSDLASLKQSVDDPDLWECDCGGGNVPLWDVVEMLRERAVAQDAATRLHSLRSAERIEFRSVNTLEMSEALYRARISGAV